MVQNVFIKCNVFSYCILLCLISALTCGHARKISKIELKPIEYESIVKPLRETIKEELPRITETTTEVPTTFQIQQPYEPEHQILPTATAEDDIHELTTIIPTIRQDTYDEADEITPPSLIELVGPEPMTIEEEDSSDELPPQMYDSNGNPIPINYITPITINSPYPYVQTHVHIPGPENLYSYIQNKRPARNSGGRHHYQNNYYRPYVTHDYSRQEPIDWNHIQNIVQGVRRLQPQNSYGRRYFEPQVISAADLDEIVIDNRQSNDNEVIFLSNNVETVPSVPSTSQDIVIKNVVSIEDVEPENNVQVKENVHQLLSNIELKHPEQKVYKINVVESTENLAEVDELNNNLVRLKIQGKVNHHELNSREQTVQNYDNVAIIKTRPGSGIHGDLTVDVHGHVRSNEQQSRENGRVDIHVHGNLQSGENGNIVVDERKHYNIHQQDDHSHILERDHLRVDAKSHESREHINIDKYTRTKTNEDQEHVITREHVNHSKDNAREHLNLHEHRNIHVDSNENQQRVKINEHENLNYRDKVHNERIHSSEGEHFNYKLNQQNGDERFYLNEHNNLNARNQQERVHLHESNRVKSNNDHLYINDHAHVDLRTPNEKINANERIVVHNDRDQEDIRFYNRGHIHNRLQNQQNQQERIRIVENVQNIDVNENQQVLINKPIRVSSINQQRPEFGYRNVQPRVLNQQVRNRLVNNRNQQNVLVSSDVSQNVVGGGQIVNQQADSTILYSNENDGSNQQNQQNILVSSDASQNVFGRGQIVNQQADSTVLYSSNESNQGSLSNQQNQQNVLVSSDVSQNVLGRGQIVNQQADSTILYSSNESNQGSLSNQQNQQNILVSSDVSQNVRGRGQIVNQQADSTILYSSNENSRGSLSNQQNQQNILVSSDVSQNVLGRGQIVNQQADSTILYSSNENNQGSLYNQQNQQNILVSSDASQNVLGRGQIVNQQADSTILYSSNENNQGSLSNHQNILVSSDASQNVVGRGRIVNQQADATILYSSNENGYGSRSNQQNRQNILVASDASQNVVGNSRLVNQQADSNILYSNVNSNRLGSSSNQRNQENILISSDVSQNVAGSGRLVNQQVDSNILYSSNANNNRHGSSSNQRNQENIVVSSDVSQNSFGLVNQQADSNILYSSNANSNRHGSLSNQRNQENILVSSDVSQNVAGNGRLVNQQADSNILYSSNANSNRHGSLSNQRNQENILVSSDVSQNSVGNGRLVNQQADSNILYSSNANSNRLGSSSNQRKQENIQVSSDASQNVIGNGRIVNQQADSNILYRNQGNSYGRVNQQYLSGRYAPINSQQSSYESTQYSQRGNYQNYRIGGPQSYRNYVPRPITVSANEPLIGKRNSDEYEQSVENTHFVQDRRNFGQIYENAQTVSAYGDEQGYYVVPQQVFVPVNQDIINSNIIADELLLDPILDNQQNFDNQEVIYVYEDSPYLDNQVYVDSQLNSGNQQVYVSSQESIVSNNGNQQVSGNINSNVNILERQNSNGASSERINIDNQESLSLRNGNQRINENINSNINVLERQNSNGASSERINIDSHESLRLRNGNQRINENINSNINVLERQNSNGASSERINIDSQESLSLRNGNQRINENINSNINVLERQNSNGASSERINIDNQESLRVRNGNQRISEKINSNINVLERQNSNSGSSERINIDSQETLKIRQNGGGISSNERINLQNNQRVTLLTNEDIESSIACNDDSSSVSSVVNNQQIVSNGNINRIDSSQVISLNQQNPEYVVLTPVVEEVGSVENIQATITYNEGGRKIIEEIEPGTENGVQHIRITSVEEDDCGDLITHQLNADVRTVIQNDNIQNQQQAITIVENLQFNENQQLQQSINDRNQIVIRTNNNNAQQLKPVEIGCDSVEVVSNVAFRPIEERRIQSFLGDCGSDGSLQRASPLPPLTVTPTNAGDVNDIINNIFIREQTACERLQNQRNQQNQLTYYVDNGQRTLPPVSVPKFVTLNSGSVYDVGSSGGNIVAISEVVPRTDSILETTVSVVNDLDQQGDVYLGDAEIGPAGALDLETLSFKKPVINSPTPQSQIVQISPDNLERLGYDKYVPETATKKAPKINVIDNDREHQRRSKQQRRQQNRGFLPFRNGYVHGIYGSIDRQTGTETATLLNTDQFRDIVANVDPQSPVTIQKLQKPCPPKELIISDNIRVINGFSD